MRLPVAHLGFRHAGGMGRAREIDPANVGRRGARWQRARKEMRERWGDRCWVCGHGLAFEADHLVRLVDGGNPYDPGNLRPAHGSNHPCPVCISPTTGRPRCCNQERNAKPRPERDTMRVNPHTL